MKTGVFAISRISPSSPKLRNCKWVGGVDNPGMSKNIRPLWIGVGVLAVMALAGCGKIKAVVEKLKKTEKPAAVEGSYSQDQISNIGKADFAGFIARKDALVIVDFHAEWCGPCKVLGPVLVKAAEAHPGVVYVGKVDVDQAPDLAAEQKVSGIPDVRIFKNGQEIDRFVGFPGEKEVLAKIARHSAGISPAAVAVTPAAPANADPEVKPFTKGWLPPGMSRKTSEEPKRP